MTDAKDLPSQSEDELGPLDKFKRGDGLADSDAHSGNYAPGEAPSQSEDEQTGFGTPSPHSGNYAPGEAPSQSDDEEFNG